MAYGLYKVRIIYNPVFTTSTHTNPIRICLCRKIYIVRHCLIAHSLIQFHSHFRFRAALNLNPRPARALLRSRPAALPAHDGGFPCVPACRRRPADAAGFGRSCCLSVRFEGFRFPFPAVCSGCYLDFPKRLWRVAVAAVRGF